MEKKRTSSSRMGQIPLEPEFAGLRAFRSVFNRLLHAAARYLPMYPEWRVAIHRLRGVKIGAGVFIGSDVFIDNTYPEKVIIDDFVTIISRCFIIAHTFTPVHLEPVLSTNKARKTGVHLKEGCYIGAQSIIMPGTEIGRCSIVAAGAVVTEDVPDYSLVAGAPARVIRQFDPSLVVLPRKSSNPAERIDRYGRGKK